MSAGSIVIDLLMKTGAFETDSKRAERRLRAFKKEAQQVGKVMGAAIAAGGALVVGTFTAMIQKQRQVIDQNAKFARSLNGSIDGLRTLQQVSEESGVDNLEASLNRLRRRLGAFEMGTGQAGKSVEALKLNVEELAAADIDERLAMIADAVRDFDGSTEQAARHLQQLGFEQKNALELFRQGGDAIRAARDDLMAFGVSMDEIDAAQVEAANDALGRTKLASEALANQLTVEFAPIMQGIAEEIQNLAKEMGGFQGVAESTLNRTVALAGFVMDAFDGVGRVITLAADGILISFNSTIAAVTGRLASLTRLADRVSPFDMSGITGDLQMAADNAEAVIAGARANIDETLMRPMPSDALDRWVEDVKERSREAAEAVVASRDAMNQGGGETGDGGAAADALAARTKEAAAFVRSTRTEIERLEAQIARVQELAAEGLFEDGRDVEVLERLQQQLDEVRRKAVEDPFGEEIAKELERGFAAASGYVASTRTEVERLEAQIAEVQRLAAEGFFPAGEDAEIVARLEERLGQARERLQEVNQFAVQASRNTQSIIADALRDGFDDGAKGIRDRFVNLINDLVAQAIAADFGRRLFGEGIGGGGGWVGAAGDFFGGIFGGQRAAGGAAMAGVTYGINEVEPEFFRPRVSGEVIPLSRAAAGGLGGVNVNQQINVTGRVDQRTASQIAIESTRRQQSAMGRLG